MLKDHLVATKYLLKFELDVKRPHVAAKWFHKQDLNVKKPLGTKWCFRCKLHLQRPLGGHQMVFKAWIIVKMTIWWQLDGFPGMCQMLINHLATIKGRSNVLILCKISPKADQKIEDTNCKHGWLKMEVPNSSWAYFERPKLTKNKISK